MEKQMTIGNEIKSAEEQKLPALTETDDGLIAPPAENNTAEEKLAVALEYWVGDWHGNFAAPKKLIHPRGQKFYFVAWDESSCGREYWLTYTRNEREDEILLADGRNWVKIPQGAAIELVKRGGQKCPAISDFVRQGGQYTRLSEPPFWAESRMSEWLEYKYRPILPYVVDIDSAEIFTGKVWINKRSHTVEQA